MKYSALDKLNLLANIYGRMFAAIFRFGTWSGFFYLGLFQALGLFALTAFYLPGLYQVINPVIACFIPETMLHYPQYYIALPSIYSALDNFVLGPTAWVIFSAFAVYRLSCYYSKEKSRPGIGLKIARGAYFRLFAFWALETGLVLLAMALPAAIASDFVAGSPNRKIALNLGLQFFAYGISAFLIYTIPGVVAGSQKLGDALRHSIILCKRNFFLTYSIVVFPSLIRVFTDFVLTEFSPRIVRLLNPEIIVVILGIQILLGVFINLFIYGSAVFVYRELT